MIDLRSLLVYQRFLRDRTDDELTTGELDEADEEEDDEATTIGGLDKREARYWSRTSSIPALSFLHVWKSWEQPWRFSDVLPRSRPMLNRRSLCENPAGNTKLGCVLKFE